MEDKNKHIDQLDAFSELFRQKLENHQMPIDPDSWSDIAQQLAPKPKQKKIFLWWMAIGSAAVLALLFSIAPFGNKNNQLELVQATHPSHIAKSDTKDVSAHFEAKQNRMNTSKNNNPNLKKIADNSIKRTPHSKAKILTEKISVNTTNINSQNTTKKNSDPTKTIIANEITSTNPTITAVQTKDSNTVITSKKVYPKITELPKNQEAERADEQPNKKSKSWLIAAAFGSGGSTSGGNRNEMLMYDAGDKMFASTQTQYTNILTPNDFSRKTFMAPLSFGLVVRKNLGDKIALETGLIYTYLYSTFEKEGNPHYNAQLKLHYMGIPFHLIVPLWKNQQWETYLSGGGMAEKGLRSIYIQHEHYNNHTVTTTARTKINGLQWSVNTSVGISYKLQHNIGLYFEPKVSYFFDNEQPVSARTDQPIVIGLTAGLRFKF